MGSVPLAVRCQFIYYINLWESQLVAEPLKKRTAQVKAPAITPHPTPLCGWSNFTLFKTRK